MMHDQAAWDLSSEFDSFEGGRFVADLARVRELAALIEALGSSLEPSLARAAALDPEADAAALDACQRSLGFSLEASTLLSDLSVYTNCVSSVDGTDAEARQFRGILSALSARLEKASSAHDLLLALASEAFVAVVLQSPEGRPHAFLVGQARKYSDRLLPLALENTVTTLSTDGFQAWGTLYDSITGTATCLLRQPQGSGTEGCLPGGTRRIGLAEAASLWRDPDPAMRQAGYEAQAETFRGHRESLAAILDSLAGWRLAEYGLRSATAPLHFLEPALAQNRMSRRTFDAMMGVVDESRELGREALRLQARLMGVPRLACWDILAPCPAAVGTAGGEARNAEYLFSEGLELVRGAYAAIDPAMGDFALEMRDTRRIEARVLSAKRPGAYCTRFAGSRRPYVFLTYRGSLADVSTLAHELGHAYHGTLLAGLPLPETHYPMTLAETASTFAEAALGDYLEAQAADPATRLSLAWSDAQDAATFLVNIPARLAFEQRLYGLRADKPLGAEALGELMRSSWEEYYGDSLRNYDEHFWMSKLHFYKTGTSFYNFPYTFGYLFSLGVYARRQALGAGFHAAYAALLRDTGRMEVEDLAQRHLGVDLSRPDFWRASVEILRAKVGRFARLVAAAGLPS
ncbi:MAG: M3 family oligoendopeptidase [Rectinemataceae bacterium]